MYWCWLELNPAQHFRLQEDVCITIFMGRVKSLNLTRSAFEYPCCVMLYSSVSKRVMHMTMTHKCMLCKPCDARWIQISCKTRTSSPCKEDQCCLHVVYYSVCNTLHYLPTYYVGYCQKKSLRLLNLFADAKCFIRLASHTFSAVSERVWLARLPCGQEDTAERPLLKKRN